MYKILGFLSILLSVTTMIFLIDSFPKVILIIFFTFIIYGLITINN